MTSVSSIYLGSTFQSYHDAEHFSHLSPAQRIKAAFYSQPPCALSSPSFSNSSANPRAVAPIRILHSPTTPSAIMVSDEASRVTFSISERPRGVDSHTSPRTPRSPPASLGSVIEEEEYEEDEEEPEFEGATIDFSSLWGASRPISSNVKRTTYRSMVPPLETIVEEERVEEDDEEGDEVYSFTGAWRHYLPGPRPSYCSISEGSISSEEPTLADWSSVTEDDDEDLDLVDEPQGARLCDVNASESVEIDSPDDALEVHSHEILRHLEEKQVLFKASSHEEYMDRSQTPTGSSSSQSQDAGSNSTKRGRRISRYLRQASSKLVNAVRR